MKKRFVMSHYVKKYFNDKNEIKQMLVFLHGYNGCVDDIDYALSFLSQGLPNAIIIAPEAEMVSEKNPLKKQWYSLRAVDKDDKRRCPDTTLSELVGIYNQYDSFLSKRAGQINLWINQWQKEYGICNQKTIIAGFSQGGMLACYTALTRENFDGKCLMFSSVVAGAEGLSKEQKSNPYVVLFHGDKDVSVNFKTMPFSLNWLNEHQIKTKSYVYKDLAHSMTEDELSDAIKEIGRNV